MTNIPIVERSDLKTLLLRQDFDVVALSGSPPPEIDLRLIQETTRDVLSRFRLIGKDRYADYTAIGLQYEDESNPLYDANNQLVYIAPTGEAHQRRPLKLMRKINEVGALYQPLFNYLSPFVQVSRARLLSAAPGFKMDSHRDGPLCGTVHFPIFTHPDCVIEIDRTPHHLPADGRFYFINVNRPHAAVNRSTIDRIHITFPLTPMSFGQWTSSDLEAFQPFLRQLKLTEEHYLDRLVGAAD